MAAGPWRGAGCVVFNNRIHKRSTNTSFYFLLRATCSAFVGLPLRRTGRANKEVGNGCLNLKRFREKVRQFLRAPYWRAWCRRIGDFHQAQAQPGDSAQTKCIFSACCSGAHDFGAK